MTTTTTFQRDGRTVAVHVLATGSPGSRTVVLSTAAPGAGTLDPDPAETARRDLTLVAVDRPGYGWSDPVPPGTWSTVDAAADDLAAALDHLDVLDPVGAVGWSAGGRVAAALAARHPGRVDRLAVVATPAPHEDVPWIPEEQAAGLEAMRSMTADEVHAALHGMLAGLADGRPEDLLPLVGAGPADHDVLADAGARARVLAVLADSVRQGAVGMAQDIAGYGMRPWGFEPGDVDARALLVFGTADPVVGAAHARWWKDALPSARVEMSPDAGHLVLLPRWGRVLQHLAAGALRR
jgi:pimeloyl-ACP methyl ester carboxylesterase